VVLRRLINKKGGRQSDDLRGFSEMKIRQLPHLEAFHARLAAQLPLTGGRSFVLGRFLDEVCFLGAL
jgi:hypothetical protein